MKTLKDVKLKLKLNIFGMIAVLIPMLIVALITVNIASKALMAAGQQSTFRIAQDLSLTTEIFMTEEIKFARELSLSSEVADTVAGVAENGLENETETVVVMDRLFKHHYTKLGEDYDLFFITDASGAIIADSMDGALRTKGVNVGDRAYFKGARQEGYPVIGPPIKSRASGKSVVAIAVPLTVGDGQFAGVICSVLKLDALSTKLTTVKIGETGYAYVISGDGTVIAHPNAEFLFKLNLSNVEGMEDISKRMLNDESGHGTYDFNGVEKVAGFAYVPMTGWSIGVTQDYSELMAPVRQMMTYSLIAAIVVIIVSGGLIFLAALAVLTPINRAVAGT